MYVDLSNLFILIQKVCVSIFVCMLILFLKLSKVWVKTRATWTSKLLLGPIKQAPKPGAVSFITKPKSKPKTVLQL